MSRSTYPLAIPDLSAFAKALREQLQKLDQAPGHVEMLNLCAKAAGYKNYQHFRAQAEPGEARPAEPLPDLDKVEKVARYFDREGRMASWPSRQNHQELCYWVMWSRIPAGEVFTEREISDLLNEWHLFGDHALLRRGMYEARLVSRTLDGREYRRIEQKPPAELSPLLARINAAVAA